MQNTSSSHDADVIDRIYSINRGKPVDQIIVADSRDLRSYVDDDTVSLVVTSPPYNVGKEYEESLSTKDYLVYLLPTWKECYRVLKNGGRLCVNVADTGRNPYIPLHSYITMQLEGIGMSMRGTLIWAKGASAGVSTSWGSWMSPSNPCLRDVHEFIVVFSKGNENLTSTFSPDIKKEEFVEWSKSIWYIDAESAKRVGHPAPFPVKLPERLIKFYTFPGDIVMDPFNGSGTTCVAAKRNGRHWLGFDINKEYVAKADTRVRKTVSVETL